MSGPKRSKFEDSGPRTFSAAVLRVMLFKLSPIDLLFAIPVVARVCREWRDVVFTDNVLWHNIYSRLFVGDPALLLTTQTPPVHLPPGEWFCKFRSRWLAQTDLQVVQPRGCHLQTGCHQPSLPHPGSTDPLERFPAVLHPAAPCRCCAAAAPTPAIAAQPPTALHTDPAWTYSMYQTTTPGTCFVGSPQRYGPSQVLLLTGQGNLLCLNMDTGAELWCLQGLFDLLPPAGARDRHPDQLPQFVFHMTPARQTDPARLAQALESHAACPLGWDTPHRAAQRALWSQELCHPSHPEPVALPRLEVPQAPAHSATPTPAPYPPAELRPDAPIYTGVVAPWDLFLVATTFRAYGTQGNIPKPKKKKKRHGRKPDTDYDPDQDDDQDWTDREDELALDEEETEKTVAYRRPFTSPITGLAVVDIPPVIPTPTSPPGGSNPWVIVATARGIECLAGRDGTLVWEWAYPPDENPAAFPAPAGPDDQIPEPISCGAPLPHQPHQTRLFPMGSTLVAYIHHRHQIALLDMANGGQLVALHADPAPMSTLTGVLCYEGALWVTGRMWTQPRDGAAGDHLVPSERMSLVGIDLVTGLPVARWSMRGVVRLCVDLSVVADMCRYVSLCVCVCRGSTWSRSCLSPVKALTGTCLSHPAPWSPTACIPPADTTTTTTRPPPRHPDPSSLVPRLHVLTPYSVVSLGLPCPHVLSRPLPPQPDGRVRLLPLSVLSENPPGTPVSLPPGCCELASPQGAMTELLADWFDSSQEWADRSAIQHAQTKYNNHEDRFVIHFGGILTPFTQSVERGIHNPKVDSVPTCTPTHLFVPLCTSWAGPCLLVLSATTGALEWVQPLPSTGDMMTTQVALMKPGRGGGLALGEFIPHPAVGPLVVPGLDKLVALRLLSEPCQPLTPSPAGNLYATHHASPPFPHPPPVLGAPPPLLDARAAQEAADMQQALDLEAAYQLDELEEEQRILEEEMGATPSPPPPPQLGSPAPPPEQQHQSVFAPRQQENHLVPPPPPPAPRP
ncbi:hypothetical protein PAPYR_8892 [Paratrimastix pyriformis]|uniref:F-box domain-containing protein n=1 Tax=Paratrimastix pyriformis TaxID=342808 RepID=A0ABQ8UDV2_9EUKA|nr:hypothetical protein PAPYR_8892 [Paratrimastix pyriformis]